MTRHCGRVLGLSVLLAVCCACEAAAESVRLVENGRSSHRIVLQPGASASEKHAADELQVHFEACTGVELPIVEGGAGDDAAMIVLGCGPVAQRFGVTPGAKELGNQGFVLRTVEPHIVIAGTREAGTLYGVHRFLEEYLRVRWYAPGVTKTPRVNDLVVGPVNRVVRPAIASRYTSYAWPGGDAEFRTRLGSNWAERDGEDPLGKGHTFDGRAHSYFWYVHPDEFFETHPEYFSEIGGVRVREETQLCLTNPDVLRIATERILARMKKYPHAVQHNFSQRDYYNYCECIRCREMNARLGTRGGTQFWFVNELAKQTSKVYPHKQVGTLAYMYTEAPPKGMKMHPNAAVWLCHMFPSCDSHPIATCPLDAAYRRRAQAWSKICDHLYIWHYIVDFAHFYNPFPNFRAMAADIRFYRDIGVEGVYLQGAPAGGEFSLLRPYYGMKLLWDPDQDADGILQDFLQGYYGAAWQPIWQYIVMLHDKVEKENIHMHLYTNPAQGYLTDSLMRRAKKLFDEAEAEVADDETLLERVKVARMPLVYARMFPRNGYKLEGDRLIWQGELASVAEMAGFVWRMRKHGFRTVREVSGDPQLLLALSVMLSMRPKVHTIRNEHLSVDVVPILAGRALRITDRKTGACVTAHNVKRVLFFPFCGGLEDRVGETFRFYGWIEPAKVVSESTESIRLELQTTDGFKLVRTLKLDADKPVLHVESVLTNSGNQARDARLRSHLELDLGELQSTRVRFVSVDGKKVDDNMKDVIAGLREGTHYYDQDLPDGSWTLTGSKGLAVTQRFDKSQMDFTWLYAYPEYLGQLDVELWAKRKTLGPGESMRLQQAIDVRPAR